jgi:DNA-binding MarR family transcriptional regulator
MEAIDPPASAPKTVDPGKARLLTLRDLRDRTLALGYPPSLSVLAKSRGLSVPGIKKQLDVLAKLGLVTRVPHQPRCTVLTEAGRKVLKNRNGDSKK